MHKVTDTQTLFAECFPDVDMGDMQFQWERFVSEIRLDPERVPRRR